MSNLPDMNQSERDGDVHVINREHEFRNDDHVNNADPADTSNFLNSLEIPTPSASNTNALFDQFNHNNEEDEIRNSIPGSADFQMSPGLTEFVNNQHPDLKLEEKPFNGTLTRFSGSLPPLQPLSESIIGKDVSLPINTALPDYVANGVSTANRSQALLSSIQKKKKEPQGPKARPAFVMKIWSMVNDPANHEFIRWNEDGQSFEVIHREQFMKKILPKYFKHNNFASFVRQLNMYGWHKVQDISSGSMKEERGQEEVLQFNNPFFIRGREDLLDNIVRNKTVSQDESQESSINFQLVINELDQIKLNQMAIIEDMRRIRNDNQTLWNESFATRERHQKQAQTLDKIMKFLAAVYGNSAGKIFEVENGPVDATYGNHVAPYANNAPKPNFVPTQQPPQTYAQPTPVLRPRLMLMDQAFQKTPVSDKNSPSVSTTGEGSVEEIVRNNSFQYPPNGETSVNVNKIYQQIMNHEPSVSSPRHFFPELNSPFPNSPSPGPFLKMNAPTQEQQADSLQGLEQNIYKQGQALLQVQDWIQTLANRQQQQQQQLQQRRSPNLSATNDADLGDFDVNEFLNNNSSHPTQNFNLPNEPTSPAEYGLENPGKRLIEEVEEDQPGDSRKKSRK